jgi:hypothetical protein
MEGALTMLGMITLCVLAFTIYDQIAVRHNRKARKR